MVYMLIEGFPGDLMVKNPLAIVRDMGSVPRQRRSPDEGNGKSLQDSCLGKSHGQKRLVGYSPWGHKIVAYHLATKQQQTTYGNRTKWSAEKQMNFDDKNKMQIKPLGFIQTPGLQPH